MKWNSMNVPNRFDWTILDCRSGMRMCEEPSWQILDIDDVEHTIHLIHAELGLVFLHAPRIIVLVDRKVILAYWRDDIMKRSNPHFIDIETTFPSVAELVP